MLLALTRIPKYFREAITEHRMTRYMRWVFIFCLGFYFGQAVEKAPDKIQSVIEAVK